MLLHFYPHNFYVMFPAQKCMCILKKSITCCLRAVLPLLSMLSKTVSKFIQFHQMKSILPALFWYFWPLIQWVSFLLQQLSVRDNWMHGISILFDCPWAMEQRGVFIRFPFLKGIEIVRNFASQRAVSNKPMILKYIESETFMWK